MNLCKLRNFRQLRSNHNISIKYQYIIPLNLQFNARYRSSLQINPTLSKTYYFFSNLVIILFVIVRSHSNVYNLKNCLGKVYVSYVNYRGNPEYYFTSCRFIYYIYETAVCWNIYYKSF